MSDYRSMFLIHRRELKLMMIDRQMDDIILTLICDYRTMLIICPNMCVLFFSPSGMLFGVVDSRWPRLKGASMCCSDVAILFFTVLCCSCLT